MKLRKVISILIAAVMVTVIMTVPSFAAKTNTGFIHASGGKLVDGNGEPYLIKGMSISNDVWLAPEEPPEYYLREESYRELE